MDNGDQNSLSLAEMVPGSKGLEVAELWVLGKPLGSEGTVFRSQTTHGWLVSSSGRA